MKSKAIFLTGATVLFWYSLPNTPRPIPELKLRPPTNESDLEEIMMPSPPERGAQCLYEHSSLNDSDIYPLPEKKNLNEEEKDAYELHINES